MAWCPICKNEYREGVTECSECKVALVDNLEDYDLVKVLYGSEEGLEEIKSYLEFNDIVNTAIEFDPEEGANAILVPVKDKIRAIKLISVFMREKEIAKLSVNSDMEFEDVKPQNTVMLGSSSDYTSSAKMAEENRSSAFALIGVGLVGIVFVLLAFFGVLPFNPRNKYLIYGVLGAMFVLFFVMGCISFKNAKTFAKKAISENSLNDSIKEWCLANLTKEVIDSSFQTAGKSEEELYFYRATFMKQKLNNQFMNLDQSFIESMIDDCLYDLTFGENA